MLGSHGRARTVRAASDGGEGEGVRVPRVSLLTCVPPPPLALSYVFFCRPDGRLREEPWRWGFDGAQSVREDRVEVLDEWERVTLSMEGR